MLTPADDPTGRATRIAKRWVVTEKVAFMEQVSCGKIRRCNGLAIQARDFVDVSVAADIRTYPTAKGGREVEVRFGMKRVIILKSGMDPPKHRNLVSVDVTV